LVADRLNLKDGGKNVQLTQAGWYYNDKGERIVQKMQIAGKQKGVQTILGERGFFTAELKLPAARKILATQPDFANQLPLLNKRWRRLVMRLSFTQNFIQNLISLKCFGAEGDCSQGLAVCGIDKYTKVREQMRSIHGCVSRKR
jgi:hypothetical protein